MAEVTRYLLGIDAGTSAVKAALFDADGREVGTASQRTRVYALQPGYSEADMHSIWLQVCATIREVCHATGIHGNQIAGVGITANMVGFWGIDAHGQPVRHAILWNDARAQTLIDQHEADAPGWMHRIFALSGSVMQSGCTLPIVHWLITHEPETLARTHTIFCCKDWLRFKLTGEIATDPTEASVMPGDTHGRTYSSLAFSLLEVEAVRDKFPRVLPSETIAGTVTADASAQTGLRIGTPVAVGAGDVPASTLGAGACAVGTACIVLGTTCLSGIVCAQPTFTPPDVGLLFCQAGGTWVRVMANIAGTSNLDWIIQQCFAHEYQQVGEQVYAHLETLAAASPTGSAGLLYLPYLSDAGIIAPVVAPKARAGFHGLAPAHTRVHLLRAVFEGVALAIRDCYAAMQVTTITPGVLAGRGANSPFWCQMIADVLDTQVQVPEGSEFGAKGAALLASVACGFDSTPQAAAERQTYTARRYFADADQHHLYDALHERYAHYRDAMLSIM